VSPDGKVTTTPSVPKEFRNIKPVSSKLVTLPGKTRVGVNTTIVCDVGSYGPGTPDGQVVIFGIAIECRGGDPAYLSSDVQMYMLQWGEYQPIPETYDHCVATLDFPRSIPGCYGATTCFQTGNYYYGEAYLYAIDELGKVHAALLFAGPVWIPCTI
jgi:hypothetical protein